ncbi:MlaA family lipoprotein [Rhodopila globiformis]|nr:VacJ family lipoprotein [Rhodopila globiformis]
MMRASIGEALRLTALLLVGFLAGCATPPPPSEPEALADFRANNDPLEPTNRVLYAINNGLDTAIVRPVARAYRAVLPQPVRNGVHNALTNMDAPIRLVNDMLEGKPRRAGDTAMRFVINSTVGVLGIFDVAARLGYPGHDADLGITMALWDVPDGPYLFVPLIGSSNVRDLLGYSVDVTANPLNWVGQGAAVTALVWARVPVAGIDARDRNDNLIETTKRTALDPYATFRSLYQQSRHATIQEVRNDHRATIPMWFPQASAGSADSGK